MFNRIVLENWMAIFPLIAFVTAGCVYAVSTFKACRMRPAQIDRFAQLPLGQENSVPHENKR